MHTSKCRHVAAGCVSHADRHLPETQINLYVRDVPAMAAFYARHFAFVETFRTPLTGLPEHIELRLGGLVLGMASIDAGRRVHRLPLDPGLPRSELVLWVDDADQAYDALVAEGVGELSPPHTFIGVLRGAWLLDPEGNHIHLVSKLAPDQTRKGRARA